MLSLRVTVGQAAVLEVALAEPPPSPFIVAVTTSLPPFADVTIVAE
jgi:hypothetical protein